MDTWYIIDWKAIIALLALILSQFPPLTQMLRRKKLRMATPSKAQFTHVLGNTNLSLWLDLENVGGRPLTVRRIEVILARVNGPSQTLTAESFWLTESFSTPKPTTLFLGEISLKPGDKWSAFLNFYDTSLLSRAVEGHINSLKSRFRDTIGIKIVERDKRMANIPQTERPPVEVDRGLLDELNAVVKDLTRLEQSEYELFLAAFEHPHDSPISILGFDLTLFDDDVHEIFGDTLDYKFGFGVYLTSSKTKYVTVRLRPKSQADSQHRFQQLSGKHVQSQS